MEKILLSIDDELLAIEGIFLKYLELPDGCRFVSVLRDPVESICEVEKTLPRKNNELVIADKPMIPYLSAYYIKDYIEWKVYNDSGVSKHYDANPHTTNSERFYSNVSKLSDEDIVRGIIPSVTREDIELLFSITNIIVNKIASILKKYRGHIVTVDVSSKYIILFIGEHIYTYRYKELNKE